MASTLKKVEVKRSVFSSDTNPDSVRSYIDKCVETGSAAVLFKDPHILAAFYLLGTAASAAITTALEAYALAPTSGNRLTTLSKMALGKLWLNDYCDQVEVISNADANRTTRGEAYNNIALSFLTPQKLVAEKKGIPQTPKIMAVNVGKGLVDVEIMNGIDSNPSQTTLIMVEISTGAALNLKNGQLIVEMADKGQVVVKAAAKKGKFTHFTELKAGIDYAVYAYSQNGKNQVSLISNAVGVTG